MESSHLRYLDRYLILVGKNKVNELSRGLVDLGSMGGGLERVGEEGI